MARTVSKAFRLPEDVAAVLQAQRNATEYVVEAVREKARRERDREIEAGLQCLAFNDEENDLSGVMAAQAKAAHLGD